MRIGIGEDRIWQHHATPTKIDNRSTGIVHNYIYIYNIYIYVTYISSTIILLSYSYFPCFGVFYPLFYCPRTAPQIPPDLSSSVTMDFAPHRPGKHDPKGCILAPVGRPSRDGLRDGCEIWDFGRVCSPQNIENFMEIDILHDANHDLHVAKMDALEKKKDPS